MKKFLRWSLMGLISSVIFMEIISRFFLGLGDPPLLVKDPDIEYMYRPGDYRRFGNRVSYNEYSMRSPPIPAGDSDHSYRILVMGDSVVNGGAQTDQDYLATELLRLSLPDDAYVGNVSAGSWGPANIYAWVERFGLLQSDHIIVVISSHDLHDLPEFRATLGVDFPVSKPIFASEELLFRYVPKFIDKIKPTKSPRDRRIENSELGQAALVKLINTLRRSDAQIDFILHPTRTEIRSGYDSNGKRIKKILHDNEIRVFEARSLLLDNMYRDEIHLNANGQFAYFKILRRLIKRR